MGAQRYHARSERLLIVFALRLFSWRRRIRLGVRQLKIVIKEIVLTTSLSIALLVLAAQTVLACTCAAPAGAAEGLTRSAAVFRGRVSEINRPFWDRVGLTNSGLSRVKFAVVKQWKGAVSKNIEVVTRLTGEACGSHSKRIKNIWSMS